jgi:repressor LexA
MKPDLTKRQIAIFDFIKREVKTKGYPPSVREICEAVGLKSTSTVHTYLGVLEQRGLIKRDPTKPRAIEILEKQKKQMKDLSMKTAYIPLIGEVTAGQPILAVENIEDQFPIPSAFISDGEYFMLQIKGESMIEAGIFDRDYVLVRQQEDASNGTIVVALIDDSATVKTFYKEQKHYRLQPENASMTPIIVDEVSILGVVKGVFRKM